MDKVAVLTPEEQETLKDSICPIKTVLVKVCCEDMKFTCH